MHQLYHHTEYPEYLLFTVKRQELAVSFSDQLRTEGSFTIKLIQSTPDKTSLKKKQSKPFNHGGARRIQQQKSVQSLHEWLAFCPHQSTTLCLCASIGDLRHAFCFGVISIFTLDTILFPLLTPHEFVFFLCLL